MGSDDPAFMRSLSNQRSLLRTSTVLAIIDRGVLFPCTIEIL